MGCDGVRLLAGELGRELGAGGGGRRVGVEGRLVGRDCIEFVPELEIEEAWK